MARIRRIMARDAYKSGHIRQAMQDGNREFISLLAFVNAAGQAFDPTLLYQGKSKDLQDSWVEDLDDDFKAFFGSTEKGWTNDAIGLIWIRKVFDPLTRDMARSRWRLLILDGHSSHVNLAFLELCESLRVAILVLPPHATHKLQPLDVTLFGALSKQYTKEANSLIINSLGLTTISKRSFLSVFRPAWEAAFSAKNIKSGFEKTGIYPFNPLIVLKTLQSPQSRVEVVIQAPKTPITSKELRQFERQCRRSPSKKNIDTLFKATYKLAAQHEIDEHIKKGLISALTDETKRRTRGKKLNLLGEEGGKAILFSTEEVQKAKRLQKEREEEEEAEKAAKEAEKKENQQRRAAEALQKALRAQERKLTAAANKAEREAAIEARKEAREARSEAAALKKQLTLEFEEANKKKASNKQTIKKDSKLVVDIEEGEPKMARVEEALRVSARGRKIQPTKKKLEGAVL